MQHGQWPAVDKVNVLYRATQPILDEVKFIECQRPIIAFSGIGAFVNTCNTDSVCRKDFDHNLNNMKVYLKIEKKTRFEITHILSAPLFHGTASLVKQQALIHRTDPEIRRGIVRAVARETLALFDLFGENITVSPVHFIFRNNELDHTFDLVPFNNEYRMHLAELLKKQSGKKKVYIDNFIKEHINDVKLIANNSIVQNSKTFTFEAYISTFPIHMFYASGGQTHWLNALLYSNHAHYVLWKSDINPSGLRYKDIIWSGSSAGLIVSGITTLMSAVKCNILGLDSCDDVQSAVAKLTDVVHNQTNLCSELQVVNDCVFRRCEFDGLAATNSVFYPHFTLQLLEGDKYQRICDLFFEPNSTTQNVVLGREYVQSRIGKRFCGRFIPLCDGEAMFMQGNSEYRLPQQTTDEHFLKARSISDTSKTQLQELKNHFPAKPVEQCAQVDAEYCYMQQRAEMFIVDDDDE